MGQGRGLQDLGENQEGGGGGDMAGPNCYVFPRGLVKTVVPSLLPSPT